MCKTQFLKYRFPVTLQISVLLQTKVSIFFDMENFFHTRILEQYISVSFSFYQIVIIFWSQFGGGRLVKRLICQMSVIKYAGFFYLELSPNLLTSYYSLVSLSIWNNGNLKVMKIIVYQIIKVWQQQQAVKSEQLQCEKTSVFTLNQSQQFLILTLLSTELFLTVLPV